LTQAGRPARDTSRQNPAADRPAAGTSLPGEVDAVEEGAHDHRWAHVPDAAAGQHRVVAVRIGVGGFDPVHVDGDGGSDQVGDDLGVADVRSMRSP